MPRNIDFSMIDQIVSQSLEKAEQLRAEERGEQDSLLQAQKQAQGPIQEPPDSHVGETSGGALQPQGAALERKREAFRDITGSRDYSRIYRIVYEYHKGHNPPTVDAEYWRTHRPGEDAAPDIEAEYWNKAAEDISAASAGGKDPFLMDLLIAVYAELEREYKAARERAARKA